MMDYAEKIRETCLEIQDMLLEKNNSYGCSVFEPMRVFSKSDTEEAIKVRIDDKLSRIQKGREYNGEDTLFDLIGYLILLLTYRKLKTDPPQDN